MHKKKVLLISYHFPPSTEVGGKRIFNFARILPLNGWNTYVLTIKDRYLSALDTAKLKDLDMVTVFKAGRLPNIKQGYLLLKGFYLKRIKKSGVTLDELEESFVHPEYDTIAQKLKDLVEMLFIGFPDEYRTWTIPALFKAVKEIKRNKIDCIVTSSPPVTSHVVGLLVKKITGVKWIADFRDPWLTPVDYTKPRPSRLLYTKIGLWMERKMIGNADKVLTTTRRLCSTYQESFKQHHPDKFIHISNGFDNALVSRCNGLNKFSTFTLSYTGTLYHGRSPEVVFKALKELISEGKINADEMRIKLIGNCKYLDGYLTSEIAKSYGLDHVVDISGQVPYLKSLEIIKRSHSALLLAVDQPLQIPAKVYDYIGLGVTILTLTGQGETSDLIKSTGVGQVFNYSDVDGIKEFLYQAFKEKDLLSTQSSIEVLSKYDTGNIVKELALLLERIT
ncbi:glycosyltransferase [Candidatus Scalindua japonica]|uniref:Glycosyltransferase n=1 Tax=Candidatus Scalindua japonica TaxID=1284222 RepID=A0A286U4B9_9BACT|nr:glycosyltransferase [Candidatus Scalindua japonica]GAX62982.1 glycosyltransferase [Candidatus Scalindua japonica]